MLGEQLINQINLMVDQKVRRATVGVVSGGKLNLSPPGGLVGHLAQTNIAYDATEAESNAGTSSLLNNLNHIRYRIATLESGGGNATVIVSETEPESPVDGLIWVDLDG